MDTKTAFRCRTNKIKKVHILGLYKPFAVFKIERLCFNFPTFYKKYATKF